VSGRGVLYIVVGDRPLFKNGAARSAASLKRVMPDMPIALVSETEIDGPFDHHIPISETDPAKIAPGAVPCRAKIIGMKQTPFEQTLYIDADTTVLADLGEVFELLDGFDMALAHAQGRVSFDLDEVPASFPEFNCGVIAYRSTPAMESFLEAWLVEYDALIPQRPKTQDQPSFRRVTYRTPGLRIATLTSEFNRKFDTAGYVKGPIRLLHGWPPADGGYEKVAEAMAAGGVDNPRVFAGGRVYDRSGKQVADFLPRWHRLRALRRRLLAR
jgi:hypothetical protein